MQLWNDYEGVTLEGAFPLRKLLMPEGRSAFFSTVGPEGEPTVVRLIECHFDEEEILARWQCVKALGHPNLLKFERFGQTELDGRQVVYAVFEKVDANLAEVLDQVSLSVTDVAQLASSLVAALDVLHTHGFIHEHIEPRNIFAINSVVKLRGDCIREAPEGEEGRVAKQRDVQSLATVLLQGLTQQVSVQGISDSAMPPPFDQIIRNGLDGTWGLEQIRVAVEGFSAKRPTAPKPMHVPTARVAVAEQRSPSAAARPSMAAEAQLPLRLPDEDRNAGFARAAARKESWGRGQGFSRSSRWLGAGIVALLLLICAWVVGHSVNSSGNKAPETAAVVSQPAVQPATQISPTPAASSTAADQPRVSLPAPAASHAGWRVIAYTYNRRADAEKKANDLARTHPELQPSVYTPGGHSRYLVSIGGVMDRDAAYALARRSRSLGLPHDLFAQNYSR